MKKTAVFVTIQGKNAIDHAYSETVQTQLNDVLNIVDLIDSIDQLDQRKDELESVSYIFSTWGMFCLDEKQIATYFPNLEAIFYAAGSIQAFARPYFNRNVRIFSAFLANAVPVAEYTVSQIILANKGFYQAATRYKAKGFDDARQYSEQHQGNYGALVGIIGAGAIGRLVIQRLKQNNLSVMVFDPFLSDEQAKQLGVQKESLETLFSSCVVISNHLANNAQTVGMLNRSLFDRMRPYTTLINTGRGQQIVEQDLVDALKNDPTQTAVLDVTYPEPIEANHAFLGMDNVILTPHIAGSLSGEIGRMGAYMFDAYCAYTNKNQSPHEITIEQLQTMA